LTKAGFKNSIPVEKGCPPYNPADLLKLYIYGYLTGISSRKWKRSAHAILKLSGFEPARKAEHSLFRAHNLKAKKRF